MPTTRTLDEKIRIAQDRARQQENHIKALIQRKKEQERKARTRRLIERGAMLENRIAGAAELTNDQIGVFLNKTLLTQFSKRILAEMTAQCAVAEPASAEPDSGVADTSKGGMEPASAEPNAGGADAPNGRAEPASAEPNGGGADTLNAGASTARVAG